MDLSNQDLRFLAASDPPELFLQIPTILVSIDSDPPEGPRVPFQMWWGIQISQAPSQIPTIWASMDSHGPQEPRFDIFELTQTLQGVLESHFKFDRKFNFLKLFCKPQQYWYPWTSPGSQQPGINIFELPQTLRGILGSHFKFGGKFNFFCGFTKPNNMNVFGPPWTSATKIWLFRADSGPLKDRRVPFQILGEINLFNFFTHPNNVM